MARTVAELPPGTRITDYISLGVVSRAFPPHKVRQVLTDTGRTSIRERDLPAHAVVYYVILLAFYMQASYREVLRCLLGACPRNFGRPCICGGVGGVVARLVSGSVAAVRRAHVSGPGASRGAKQSL